MKKEEKYDVEKEIEKISGDNKLYLSDPLEAEALKLAGFLPLVHKELLSFLEKKEKNGFYILYVTDPNHKEHQYPFKISYQGNPEPKEEIIEEGMLKEKLIEAYRNILDVLKEYIDLKEEYYNIVALWIIGTYFHKEFSSYPFLFFNAQKSSGKSRIMNLITCLSKDGSVMNSMTEAVLFRTKGTLAIDEFEGISRKGNENLRELLNSSYKKGIKVKRMKQQKTFGGTEQVVEEFEVYRPIVLANIWGMETVLGDRCITLILEKSNRKEIVNLIEVFSEEKIVQNTKKLLKSCSLCRCSFSAEAYKAWNSYIKHNYTNYTNNTNNINYINYIEVFKSINLMELNGRELELSLPICLIASEISEDVLKETTLTLKNSFYEKRIEELVEDKDVSLIDFVSQFPDSYFHQVNKITTEFKQFLDITDEWINSRWMGRALKRLALIKEKRRRERGVEVILNVEKAQKKIKMFK